MIAILAVARFVAPDPIDRANGLYVSVVALGYGHIIGGVVFGWGQLWKQASPFWASARGGALGLSLLATVLAAYLWVVGAWPAALVPLLAFSAWHAVENDLAWARDSRGGLSIGPWAPVGQTLGVTAFVMAASVAAVPDVWGRDVAWSQMVGPWGRIDWLARAVALVAGLWMLHTRSSRHAGVTLALATLLLPADVTRWVGAIEIFGAWTLYHMLSWLFVSVRKIAVGWAECPDAGRRRLTRLIVVHVVPALAAALVLAAPIAWDHPLRVMIFAPSLYLFWALLHVAQTALNRKSGDGRRRAGLLPA